MTVLRHCPDEDVTFCCFRAAAHESWQKQSASHGYGFRAQQLALSSPGGTKQSKACQRQEAVQLTASDSMLLL